MSTKQGNEARAGYTAGPWHTKGTVVLVSPRLIIAEVDRGTKHPDTARANARLIAAAPVLLEALQTIAEFWEHGHALSPCAVLNERDETIGQLVKAVINTALGADAEGGAMNAEKDFGD